MQCAEERDVKYSANKSMWLEIFVKWKLIFSYCPVVPVFQQANANYVYFMIFCQKPFYGLIASFYNFYSISVTFIL